LLGVSVAIHSGLALIVVLGTYGTPICVFTSSGMPGFDGLLRSPLAMTNLAVSKA